MNLRRIAAPILNTLFALFVLTACGGPGPVGTPTPEVSLLPLETATPAVTATPMLPSLPSPTPKPTAVPGALFVDAALALGPINPLVYGTNTGPWQDLTKSMMPYIESAGFTFLRFPGGNWGDEYVLAEARLDEYIALCRQLGAEPMVNVKLFKAKPESAAYWVEYANVTKGYGIKYWGIGNEPSLYATNRKLEGYDTVTYNQQWREFALAMEAVDPTIVLVGPEMHQFTGRPFEDPTDAHNKDWLREFLVANGDLVDVVAIHRYPFGTYDPSPNELLRSSAEWDTIIPNLRALIRETTGRDLPIAVTEVNSNWATRAGKEGTPDSFANAIWWADVLGRLIAQRVDIVAQFGLAGGGGAGLMATRGPRPSYYVYPLYKQFGSELVYASSDDEAVRIYAARREDGALTLMIVNLGDEDAKKPLVLANFTASGPAETWRLDAEHNAELIDPTPLDAPLNLPALSVTLLVIGP